VVVGALFIGDKEKPAFSPGEKGLLEAIGKEIGAGVLRSLLHKRLEAANREANLYLDIMTHDIRNAENVASLYSDLLVEMLDGQAAEYAEKVRDSIRKGTEIVRHVSTIRKIRQESSPLEPVCLDPVIRDRILDRPNITVASSSNLPEVWADEFLSEVFERLIDNSIQFAGSAAEITVRVEECDDEAVVSVEDTGPGVPDALKEAIFHRFEREKNQGTGKGFGLYIARMLVERYGGRIWVEDRVEGRPDLGAAFRFTLRIVEADLDRPRYSEEDEITEDDFDA
jgi:two-component system sensor histidine kinase KdpD